jgi:hypothetical protein
MQKKMSSLSKTKNTESQKNIMSAAEEITSIKERLQQESDMQMQMDEDIKTLQKEIIE